MDTEISLLFHLTGQDQMLKLSDGKTVHCCSSKVRAPPRDVDAYSPPCASLLCSIGADERVPSSWEEECEVKCKQTKRKIQRVGAKAAFLCTYRDCGEESVVAVVAVVTV